MQQWLPKRVAIHNGQIFSVNRDPLTQRDCILFDDMESPVYEQKGSVVLVPIEGVLGAVEVNSGENTTYQKIGRDATKLSEIAEMAQDRLPPAAQAQSHLPPTVNMATVSSEQLISSLFLHRTIPGKPHLVIFAEQLDGSLLECCRRLKEHNKKVGINQSVDALFVLRQGFAAHLDPQQAGWTTSRLPGSSFACLQARPGTVLLRMQSLILMNLYLAGKVYPGGFDRYTARTGQAEQEVAACSRVSDEDYVRQSGGPGYVQVRA
jgi:hypothetical protein